MHKKLAAGHDERVVEALMPYLSGHANPDDRQDPGHRAAMRGG
jgi:hypothetical protein